MRTSEQWLEHFRNNLRVNRINWTLKPSITGNEAEQILKSLQAWQLGETSEGKNLLAASTQYANKIGDRHYPEAVKLFIKEEQKHGNNLGLYLDAIGKPRIKKDWGDSLFRAIRYHNASMELWTLAVITVESTAQIFYQSLKDASNCELLKQICTDILIDEAYHIDFQYERFLIIFQSKSKIARLFSYQFYSLFYFSTILVVWLAHKKAFKAGNNNFRKYWRKMKLKFSKTIGRLKKESLIQNTTSNDTDKKTSIAVAGVINTQNSLAADLAVQKK
jgi:hypothetical protein